MAARILDGMISIGSDHWTGREQHAGATTLAPPIGIVARNSTEMLAVADPNVGKAVEAIRERAFGKLSVAELAEIAEPARWKLEKRFCEAAGHSVHEISAPLRNHPAQFRTLEQRCAVVRSEQSEDVRCE